MTTNNNNHHDPKIKYIHASIMQICKLDMSHIEVVCNIGEQKNNLLSKTISDAPDDTLNENNNVVYDFSSVSGFGSSLLYNP